MSILSRRAVGWRPLAVLMVATLAFASMVIFRGQLGASADTKTTAVSVTCPIVGAVSVNITASDTPDPAVEGGSVTLDVKSGAPSIPITVTINSITLVVPAPAQVASLDSVSFSGGNLTGAYTVAANKASVSVVFTGPVQSTAVDLPTMSIKTTLKTGIAGQTIAWSGPSSISSNVAGLGEQACTSAASNPSIQTTAVQAAPTPTTTTTQAPTTTVPAPTTTKAPTTTVPAPTTTKAPTTTVPAPTTTKAPTTTVPAPTTTKAPTTTVPAPTTTKAPTTTRPAPTTTRPTSSNPGLDFLRLLLCKIFRIGCGGGHR